MSGGLTAGDVWCVTPMARPLWYAQPPEIWAKVEDGLMQGWGGKVQDAMRLTGQDVFTGRVALVADELGAPVGQMFTVVVMRLRGGEDG